MRPPCANKEEIILIEKLLIPLNFETTSKTTKPKGTPERSRQNCLDVSKLIIGGVIIAGIMELEVRLMPLFLLGGVAALFFLVTGFHLFQISNQNT